MAFKRNNNVIDSPGNSFATLNPLDTGSSVSITKGNLLASSTSELVDFTITRATMVFPKTGIYYFECRFISSSNGGWFGIDNAYGRITGNQNGWNNGTASIGRNGNGDFYLSSDASSIGTETHNTSGEVIPVVWDADEKKLYTHQGKPSSIQLSDYNYSGAISVVSGNFFPIVGSRYTATDSYLNFGQDHTFGGAKTDSAGPYSDASGLGSFYYEPPPGALALCTANLPLFDGNPQEHFKPVVYQVINQNNVEVDVNVGFNPDLTWIKNTDNVENHYIMDTVRDPSYNTLLKAGGETGPEFDISAENENITITKKTTGFSLETTNSNAGELYYQNRKYICWNWKAGGGGGKYNIDGVPHLDFADTGLTTDDITPDGISVNTKAGFSIINFNSGAANDSASIPHGLNQRPDFFTMKQTNGSGAWWVWHSAFSTASNYLYLNEAFDLDYLTQGDNMWGAGHDAKKIGFESGWGILTNQQYICYAWHSVPGYSAFGSYNGNGSPDGPFIYTGFKPAFLMVKRTDEDNNWYIGDTERDPFNPGFVKLLSPNNKGPEGVDAAQATDFLENGFKFRTTQAFANSSTGQYIYMAFAEQPFATKEEDRYYTPKIFNINKIVVAPTEVKNADCWLSPENMVLDSNGHVTAWEDPINSLVYSKYNLTSHSTSGGKTDIYHVPFRNGHYGISVCGPNLSDYGDQRSTVSLVGPRPIGGSGPDYSQWSAMLVLYGIAMGHGYNECWVGMNQTSSVDGHWSIGPDRIHTWGGVYNEIGGTQRDLSTPQYRIWFAHYNSHLKCFDKTAGGWTEVNSGGGSIPSVPGNMSLLQFQYATHPYHNAAGTLAEVILWNSAIDDSTRDAAGNYLNAKYQIV